MMVSGKVVVVVFVKRVDEFRGSRLKLMRIVNRFPLGDSGVVGGG